MNTRGQGLDDATPTRKRGKNYLFAIAIDHYRHSPPLYNCVRDAHRIISVLQRDYQFEPEETFTLFNEEATEKNIFDTFKKLISTVRAEDNLLILYSGHGEFETEVEEGYWIPVDAQLGDFSDYVSNSRIVKYLKALDAHHILLIVDSCFSGTLFAHRKLSNSHKGARLDDIPSRWLITAGRNEIVSDGKPGDHSPFADNIIYFLEQNRSDSLSVGDLSDSVVDAVIYNSRQTPRGEPLQDVGHRGGQFFFHRKGFIPPAGPVVSDNARQEDTGEPDVIDQTEAGKASSGSGFWIFGAIAVGVLILVFLAGSFFRPKAVMAPSAPEHNPSAELPEETPSSINPAGETEENPPANDPEPANASRQDRMERAWLAATETDTEAAYRRFLDRYPKSSRSSEAENRISGKYRYELNFGPTLQGGRKLTIHFGRGQAPFEIQIIKPNQEKILRSWDASTPFILDLGELEKVKSGVNVLKVIVTDRNFKKAGHALPVY